MRFFNQLRDDADLHLGELSDAQQDIAFLKELQRFVSFDKSCDCDVFVYTPHNYPIEHPYYDLTKQAPTYKEFAGSGNPKVIFCLVPCVYRNDPHLYTANIKPLVTQKAIQLIKCKQELLGVNSDIETQLKQLQQFAKGWDLEARMAYVKQDLQQLVPCRTIVLVQYKSILEQLYPNIFHWPDMPHVVFTDIKQGMIDFTQINDKPIAQRSTDVIVTGTCSSTVYPYRYIYRNAKSKQIAEAGFITADTYKDYLASRIAYVNAKTQKEIVIAAQARAQQYVDYLRALSKSKISICCASVFSYPLGKYVESMSQGCVVVGQEFPNYEHYGFIPDKNIVFCDIAELGRVCINLLRDTCRMQEIQNASIELAKTKLNWTAEIRRMLDLSSTM